MTGDTRERRETQHQAASPLPLQNIAIVADYIHNYQAHLLTGIRQVLDARGISSTVYVGRELVPEGHSMRVANEVYNLIRPQQHSGVILMTANLARNTSDEELMAFASRFGSLPTISIGRKIEGIPSVTIDNRPGMEALMDHLIVTRGLKRFVFVRGRLGNEDSNVREQVFREKMSAYGLTVREDWILNGDFRLGVAHAEMTRLLTTTRDFDVVVAANDEMADGVITALREHGRRVPDDVAVVGFDDDENYWNAIPPLTTVRQPFADQARLSAEKLFAEGTPSDLRIPSQLVVRESCGAKEAAPFPSPFRHQDAAYSGIHEEIFKRYCCAAARPEQHQQFLTYWKATLLKNLHQDHHFVVWRALLTDFRRRVRPTLTSALRAEFEALHSEAQTLLYDALQMAHVHQRLTETSNAVLLSNMTSAVTYEAMLDAARKYLKNLGLERVILVMYTSFASSPLLAAVWCLRKALPVP